MGKTIMAIVTVVAVVAIAVFAPELAPGLVSFLGSVGITVSTAVATAIITATLTAALGLALSLAYKSLGAGSIPKASQTATPQVFRQSITDSFIVYGKRRVGGLLIFFHAKQSGSDHFRYFAIACAGHRCKGVVSWMLADEVVTVDGSGMVTSGKYANAAWLWFQRGLASETANATFVAECDGKWTTSHKGNGIAAIYAKFKLTDAVVQAGMPNITAVIEGRDEIRDSRDASIGYTRNFALIFYDWMSMAREEGGFGAYADEIPDDAWISAQANVCDEVVNGNPRYACDAYMTTGAAPGQVRDAMIVNMAGSYTYTGGKHLMRPGYWVPASITLEEADLAGPIQVSPFMTSDASANQVEGTFVDPANGYQGMPFTTWMRPGATDIRQLELDLAFTTVRDQADRVAAIMGKRAACEKTVVWPMNILGIKVRALDTVQLNSPRYGLNNYAWVVANWGLSFDPTSGPGVVLTMREENSEIYDDPAPTSPPAPPTIQQPSTPLQTATEVQNLIVSSAMVGLTFTVGIPSGGNSAVTINGPYNRVYSDKTVSVNGNSGPVSVAAATGDKLWAFYDDPDRAGGAVTYQYLVLAGGAGDASSAFASPAHPYRHTVVAGYPVPGSGDPTTGGSDPGTGGGSGGGRWELGDNR